MVMPSLIEMVANSKAVPPAASIPSLTHWATDRWLKLQGPVSLHMWATPMLGLASRSRVNPSGRSIALAVAKPVIVALRSGTPPFSDMHFLRIMSWPASGRKAYTQDPSPTHATQVGHGPRLLADPNSTSCTDKRRLQRRHIPDVS